MEYACFHHFMWKSWGSTPFSWEVGSIEISEWDVLCSLLLEANAIWIGSEEYTSFGKWVHMPSQLKMEWLIAELALERIEWRSSALRSSHFAWSLGMLGRYTVASIDCFGHRWTMGPVQSRSPTDLSGLGRLLNMDVDGFLQGWRCQIPSPQ